MTETRTAQQTEQTALHHIEWVGNAETGHLRLLDQTHLPNEQHWIDCDDEDVVWHAIRQLSVRGAPAIGIAAAYGCVMGAQRNEFRQAADYLETSRPTAFNLFWAIDRMRKVAASTDPEKQGHDHYLDALLREARLIHEEDRKACRAIGEQALELLRDLTGDDLKLLTHCNAGALATGGIGTATAPMYIARERSLPLQVFADETRPLLQGARLTAYELQAAGIDVTLITDSTAAAVMHSGRVNAVITGADRIAANGDTANKIGTYALAILAKYHGLPFVIAAPTSTIDLDTPDGDSIPIEERSSDEVTGGFGLRIAPRNVSTLAPAFDVTPASLITAIVTERGVIRPVDEEHVRSNCR